MVIPNLHRRKLKLDHGSIFFFSFSWLRLQHMEVPRLGVKLQLQLSAYTTATVTLQPEATQDP